MTTIEHHADADQRLAKTIATLRARLALRGLQLSDLAGGAWLVHAHNTSTTCADLREVQALVEQVEGTR
jgi:3-oxoacyl-(acyl-carrier-protein) synthase